MSEENQPPAKPATARGWAAPFVWAEWGMEWAVYSLGRLAVFAVFEYVLKIAALGSVLVGAVTFVVDFSRRGEREAEQRRLERERSIQERKIKHYQAWQVINLAQGQRSDGGRRDAIEDLVRDEVDLQGLSITNANLNGIDLKRGRLRRAEMAGADLKKADLRHADLTNADLRLADLREADLKDAILINVDFEGAKLQGAGLHAKTLADVNLRHAVLQDARFDPDAVKACRNWRLAIYDPANRDALGLPPTYLHDANLNAADLRYTDLSGMDLTGAKLNFCNIRGTRFARATLTKVQLVNANVVPASDSARRTYSPQPKIAGTATSGPTMPPSAYLARSLVTDFSGAVLEEADLRRGDFTGANFERAHLNRADLRNAILVYANLREAELQGAKLHNDDAAGRTIESGESHARGAKLEGADLQGARLEGADLTGVDLRGANLKGADLTEANLEGAVLDNPEQVKVAKNWQKARYSQKLQMSLGLNTPAQAVPVPPPVPPPAPAPAPLPPGQLP